METGMVRYKNSGVQRYVPQAQSDLQRRKKTTRLVLIGVGTAGALVGIYFLGRWAYKKFKSAGAEKDVPLPPATTTPPPETKTTDTTKKTTNTPKTTSTTPANTESSFPLSKGSRGNKVKQIQSALVAKYGSSVLGSSTIDGVWGDKTENALVSNSYKNIINQDDYVALVYPYLRGLAATIRTNALAKDYEKTKASIKKLFTVNDYVTASDEFKKTSFDGNHDMSILSAVFHQFPNNSKELDNIFRGMGIIGDENGKYHLPEDTSLKGIQEYNIMTLRPTNVFITGEGIVNVEESVLLGKAVGEKGEYISIENNGKELLALPADVMLV